MALDCISGYVGIRGCGATAPTSGLYLNDLPGISFKKIVSLTDHDATTYAELMTVLESRAAVRLAADVRTAFARRYTLKTSADCSFGDVICDNIDLFAQAVWYLLGYEFFTEVVFSDKLNEFTTVGLQRAKELRDYYLIQYMGGTIREGDNYRHVDGVLNQIVDNMSLDEYDECYECSGQFQIVEHSHKFFKR